MTDPQDPLELALSRQPMPMAPPGLVYRTQLLLAAEADRRQSTRLAIAASLAAWVLVLASWQVAPLWTLWSTVTAASGTALTGALVVQARRRSI
jgi:hypothetical protein